MRLYGKAEPLRIHRQNVSVIGADVSLESLLEPKPKPSISTVEENVKTPADRIETPHVTSLPKTQPEAAGPLPAAPDSRPIP